MDLNVIFSLAHFVTFLAAVLYGPIQAFYDGIRQGLRGEQYRARLFLHPALIVGTNWLFALLSITTVPPRYAIRLDIIVVPAMSAVATLVAFIASKRFWRTKAESKATAI